jgi:hypothetical protein
VVVVVQLGLIFHFILNPEQRRVLQLVININETTNAFLYTHISVYVCDLGALRQMGSKLEIAI